MDKEMVKSVRKQLLNFSIPAFLSAVFSELYSLTNSAIVGNYVSLEALSAVSACSWICSIFNYTFYGLGMGAGILIGKCVGAKDNAKLKKSMDSIVLFAIFGGIVITLVSELCLPLMMDVCNIQTDIYDMAESYLRIYILGTTAVLTYDMCFFVLRSFGDTKHQLYYSIVSSLVNLILGLILVRVFNLNVIGTAIATIISQFVMDFLALHLLFNYKDNVKLDIKHMEFSFDVIKEICRLGIPAGIQNLLIAISSMLVQSYVNLFPNEIISGVGVAEKTAAWAQLPSVAITAGTMAMVSQNVGAEDYPRAREVIRQSLILGEIATGVAAVMMFVLAPYAVGFFNDNAQVIQAGSTMTRIMIFSYLFLNLSHVYNAACRGAGNVRVPMLVGIAGQVLSKYLFVRIGLSLYYSPMILYCGSAFGYSVAGILAALYFNLSPWSLQQQLRVKKGS